MVFGCRSPTVAQMYPLGSSQYEMKVSDFVGFLGYSAVAMIGLTLNIRL